MRAGGLLEPFVEARRLLLLLHLHQLRFELRVQPRMRRRLLRGHLPRLPSSHTATTKSGEIVT